MGVNTVVIDHPPAITITIATDSPLTRDEWKSIGLIAKITERVARERRENR